MPPVNTVRTLVTIGSNFTDGPTPIPVLEWSCNYSAYGSLNHFHMKTSIQALKTTGFDIFAEQEKNDNFPIQVHVVINNQSTMIFSGLIDAVDAYWHDDILEISGRDISSVFRDQNLTMTEINYRNQPISSVVQQIVAKVSSKLQSSGISFSSQVTPTPGYNAGIRYWPTGGAEYTFSDRSRPAWSILQLLANETGFLLYVKPGAADGSSATVVFSQPGAFTQNNWSYFWRPQQKTISTTSTPIMELHATQQSHRCKNFVVNVWSYDRSSKQHTEAQAIDGDGSGLIYNRNVPGFATPDDCDRQAKAIKAEIQRKKNTFKFTVEGNPQLQIGDLVTVYESEPGDLLGLSGVPCFISGLGQSFTMPDYGSETAEGFFSHITATKYTQVEED